jgi:hypothetical protein
MLSHDRCRGNVWHKADVPPVCKGVDFSTDPVGLRSSPMMLLGKDSIIKGSA